MRDSTKWIICMWDIRGDDVYDTAKLLKIPLEDVNATIDECKADGFYDKVRRHIEAFDRTNEIKFIKNFDGIGSHTSRKLNIEDFEYSEFDINT